MLISCPSGLTFSARPWKLKDRKVLMDVSVARKGRTHLKMLEIIAEGVDNPGPYNFAPGSPPNFNDVAYADVSAALFSVRAETKPTYEFDAPCSFCGSVLPLMVQLPELARTPMSQEALDQLRTDVPIRLKVPGGDVEAYLRVLRGRDLPAIAVGSKGDPAEGLEIETCLHIMKLVTGGNELNDQLQIRRAYGDADYRLHSALREKIDSFGGQVDTDVQQTCRQCKREVTVSLPLDMAFFDPSLEPRRKSTEPP